MLTCGHDCTIARSLVHITALLPGPTCPLLDFTPSIEGGTINDVNIPNDVKWSLFHTQHHPQVVPPWVEISLHNISLVRRH